MWLKVDGYWKSWGTWSSMGGVTQWVRRVLLLLLYYGRISSFCNVPSWVCNGSRWVWKIVAVLSLPGVCMCGGWGLIKVAKLFGLQWQLLVGKVALTLSLPGACIHVAQVCWRWQYCWPGVLCSRILLVALGVCFNLPIVQLWIIFIFLCPHPSEPASAQDFCHLKGSFSPQSFSVWEQLTF